MKRLFYFYQNIWTTAADLSKNVIKIYNENFFRDLSAYYLEWELLKNGIPLRGERVENLDVSPTQTAPLNIDWGKINVSSEWLLNIRYIQRCCSYT